MVKSVLYFLIVPLKELVFIDFKKNSFRFAKHVDEYDETLNSKKESKFDIVAFYKSPTSYQTVLRDTINYLIQGRIDEISIPWDWKREKPIKEMTIEEIEKTLGYKIKIVNKKED
jgi:hypothetical protein